MKKKAFYAITMLMCLNSFAQKVNKTIIDTKTQKTILYGKCNLKGLQTGDYGEIYRMEFKYYTPDSQIIEQLKPVLKKISFKIVMGSWCGDSREQIPRFIKILDLSEYNTRKIDIISLDHYFKLEGFDIKKFDIKKLPTLIVYRKKKEIGRIIETPVETLEKDLIKILKSDYKL